MSDLFVTHHHGRVLPPQEEGNVLTPQEREEMLAGGAVCPNCGDSPEGCDYCSVDDPPQEEVEPPEVKNLILVGGAYQRGRYLPGWGVITLVGGEEIRIPAKDDPPSEEGDPCWFGGFDGLLRWAEDEGYDTTRMRERLDEWTRTGTMPPHMEG
jgi:hypothetical protein